jgi:hypothetical protein
MSIHNNVRLGFTVVLKISVYIAPLVDAVFCIVVDTSKKLILIFFGLQAKKSSPIRHPEKDRLREDGHLENCMQFLHFKICHCQCWWLAKNLRLFLSTRTHFGGLITNTIKK